jgi:hypothetical protein
LAAVEACPDVTGWVALPSSFSPIKSLHPFYSNFLNRQLSIPLSVKILNIIVKDYTFAGIFSKWQLHLIHNLVNSDPK